jgi:hypothetical protein
VIANSRETDEIMKLLIGSFQRRRHWRENSNKSVNGAESAPIQISEAVIEMSTVMDHRRVEAIKDE